MDPRLALIVFMNPVDITSMDTHKTSRIYHQLTCWRCDRPAAMMIRDGSGLCALHLVNFADPRRVPTAMAMRPSPQRTTTAA